MKLQDRRRTKYWEENSTTQKVLITGPRKAIWDPNEGERHSGVKTEDYGFQEAIQEVY